MTDALVKEINEAISQLEGWATMDKALAMAKLIQDVSPALIVEIGVFGGKSLIPQAMALRANGSGVVVGIDPWRKENAIEGDNDKSNNDWWARLDLNAIHNGCMEAIWRHDLTKWTRVLRMSSTEALDLLEGNQKRIDILHVDGNHSSQASMRDVLDYLPLVVPGGHVWMDDTDWATTQAAVAVLDEYGDRVKQIGNCILFKLKYVNWFGLASDLFRNRLAERKANG